MSNLKDIINRSKDRADHKTEKAAPVKPSEDDNKSEKEDKVPAGGKTLTGQQANKIDLEPNVYKPIKEEEVIDEGKVLNAQQRMKRAIQFRRIKTRVQIGRQRAMRRRAPRKVLVKRARRLAIKNLRMRVLKNRKYGDLTYGQRASIDARIRRSKKSLTRLAKKLLPRVARAEASRKLGSKFLSPQMSATPITEAELNTAMQMIQNLLPDYDYELSESETTALEKKAYFYDMPVDVLEEIFRRGLTTWELDESTTISHSEYAFNRINSFLEGGDAFDLDYDLIEDELTTVPVDVAPVQTKEVRVHGKKIDSVEHGTKKRPASIDRQVWSRVYEATRPKSTEKKLDDRLNKLDPKRQKRHDDIKAIFKKYHTPQIQEHWTELGHDAPWTPPEAHRVGHKVRTSDGVHGVISAMAPSKKYASVRDNSGNHIGNFPVGKLHVMKEEAMPEGGEKRRVDMPQLGNFEAFQADLKKHGHELASKIVHPGSLSPLQKHFSQEKVDKIIADKAHDKKPIIVSKDNKVIDGHHRWKACDQLGCKVPTRVVPMTADDLLDFVKDKPYATSKKLHEASNDEETNAAWHEAQHHYEAAKKYHPGQKKYHEHMELHHNAAASYHELTGDEDEQDRHEHLARTHAFKSSALTGKLHEEKDAYDVADDHKKKALKYKEGSVLYHSHMAQHHEALGVWSESKKRYHAADREFKKAAEHHEKMIMHPNYPA